MECNIIQNYLGLNGESIERDPINFPYSYDLYFLKGIEPNNLKEDNLKSVYTDRLIKNDYEKYNKIMKEVVGSETQYFNELSNNQIEEFLKKYYNDNSISVVRVF